MAYNKDDIRVVYTNGLRKALEGYASTDQTYSVLEGCIVEICPVPINAYSPGGTTIQLRHEKEGYESFLLFCPQYGIDAGLFAYVKESGVDTAEIYVQNRNTATVTKSLGDTIWICAPLVVENNG